MSRIKSFAVGFGDMFYIDHNSDNFTIIDCFLNEQNATIILDQIDLIRKEKEKIVTRVISTHPDDDHIQGLELLDAKIGIKNFYCVKNNVEKEDQTDSFDKYRELRDSSKAFHIFKGCRRMWMNEEGEGRGSSGIDILWPDQNNRHYKDALADAEAGGSPNNISAVIQYSLNGGVKVLWFGDLHKDFMELIEDQLDISPADIVFAPHHGRRTGRIPRSILDKIKPKIIVIGEAATEYLEYYYGYNTITQNSAGDVICECLQKKVHVFTSKIYEAEYLDNERATLPGCYYVGTLNLG